MKKKPLFICPSCNHEGVKRFVVSEEQFTHYNEPFTVRKKTRICEKCEHAFVPEAEVTRREKLLKLMIVSLFLSRCDKSKKELTKINKKLQKISKGLNYNDNNLRVKYLDLENIEINEDELKKEILKTNPYIKKNEDLIQEEMQIWIENKKEFVKNNPEKHKEQLLKQSVKDKSFIFNNNMYLIELVYELIQELGNKSEIEIVNEEGKTEKITVKKLENFLDEILENQSNLKQYEEIYETEMVIVREMLKEEESEDDLEELSRF